MRKILGLGNPLVDVLTVLESDELLHDLSLPKGSMQLIDAGRSEKISTKIKHREQFLVSGGSASNTIHGLAQLGVPVGFVGKIGKDKHGSFFYNDSRQNGVTPHLLECDYPSGVCISLVSPDGERTMATCLGAACEMTSFDLDEDVFREYDYCHIEGYWVQNKDLIEHAMKLAKAHRLKISLDLASYNIVEENRLFLTNLVHNYVDILFANEDEAKVFTGKEPEDALEEMSKMCEIAVVKLGAKGSLIKSGNEKQEIPAQLDVACLDTTGAGDLYAAGFLYGLTKGLSLSECGKIGSLVAANVIQVIGTKMEQERWDAIHCELRKLR